MGHRRIPTWRRALILCTATIALAVAARAIVAAVDLPGQVMFNGLPVPGALVTAAAGGKTIAATSNENGQYVLGGLDEGNWTITVEMPGFEPFVQNIAIAPNTPPLMFEMKLQSFDEMKKIAIVQTPTQAAPSGPSATARSTKEATAASDTPAAPIREPEPSELERAAADGFLINGSVNNGAASPFAQPRAFGNNRPNQRSLYNGGVAVVFGGSALDARPFSFTIEPAPKPSYADAQVSGTFGGPLKIPGVRNRPVLFVGYQRMSDHTATAQSAVMPTAAERNGDFSHSTDGSGRAVQIVDPETGLPFVNNAIPFSRISTQALALLGFYPQPNLESGGRYNFQTPVLTVTRQDSLQSRFTQSLSTRSSLFGNLQYQRTRKTSAGVFGFPDESNQSTLDAQLNWSRRFSQFLSLRVTYQFNRQTTDATPYFANRRNVSGEAGISGNDQTPVNWGPPALIFSSGLAGLSDGIYIRSRSRAHGLAAESNWRTRGRHSFTFGGAWRPQTVDINSQLDPRGKFSFTGAATGSAFADFLLGLPHTSSIAFGNADKELRAPSANAYLSDDWRISSSLTVNVGARWEYEAPFTEAGGRLANLEQLGRFSSVNRIVADRSDALLHPDKRGIQPRLATSWRPLAASSLVIRAGYGIYRNTNVYQPIATLLAQQPPSSKTFSVETAPSFPLALAKGFVRPGNEVSNTFAVDPDFRVGYAHNWQLSVQRDLPWSLTVIATYLGTRGRHLMQEFVPNTYPAGAANPCATCPTSFVYMTSNGRSVRNAGQVQLRRRLRNGLTATTQYTFSKANDNAAAFAGADLNGLIVAQDWLHLENEWGRSTFDQRHLLTTEFEYTRKAWTITGQLNAGSGLPQTPVYLGSLAGTGIVGALRADYTGAPLEAPGYYVNPAAFAPPASGSWGSAARNSITGPSQFTFNMGLARTFLTRTRLTFEWHVDATNVLNRVTYSTVDTVVGSPQFGLPSSANAMRKLQTSLRMRF